MTRKHTSRLPRDVARLEGPLQLHDGQVIHVRAIRPSDDERLRAFHRHLSPDAIMFRFFHMLPELPAPDAEHFTHVDYVNRMALLATTGSATMDEILGVVRYDRIGDTTAEVAFVVADAWQGHGIATALLHRLAAYARTRGISTFVAITMGSNARMIEVLRNSGFPLTTRYSAGTLEVHLDITKPPVFPGSP
ncbi:MAG TPA: GNAT family N-acetyltransferase [Ktedonobacterales bacterium]|nr:GNAT family N-acetyltransferase [Ktedonobacterales bacterium]